MTLEKDLDKKLKRRREAYSGTCWVWKYRQNCTFILFKKWRNPRKNVCIAQLRQKIANNENILYFWYENDSWAHLKKMSVNRLINFFDKRIREK